jgi:hypothetical protein
MRRSITAALTVVVALSAVHSAQAVFVDHGAHYMKQTYHMNQMWPWPFQCADRIAVREPFCIMVNNGWRRQNLLGAHHFNPGTNQLSTAGQLRVQWIMTQAPPDRRSIFIERTIDPETNNQRLVAVRDYGIKVSTDGHEPMVEETYLMTEGRPAAVVDATNVNFLKSMPPPVLPAATDTSTGQ